MGSCMSTDIPTISIKDCCKNVSCKSECSSSCCMYRSKAKHQHKNKVHSYNDKPSAEQR